MSFRMPAEWEPHGRTLMVRPLPPSWGRHLEGAGQACAGPHCATMQIPESGGAS